MARYFVNTVHVLVSIPDDEDTPYACDTLSGNLTDNGIYTHPKDGEMYGVLDWGYARYARDDAGWVEVPAADVVDEQGFVVDEGSFYRFVPGAEVPA